MVPVSEKHPRNFLSYEKHKVFNVVYCEPRLSSI